MPGQEIQKLYYSISEVSEITGIDSHVLRYWETEFKELAPRKNRSGKRQYRQSDIDLIKKVQNLLYVERYTIEGARRQLRLGRTAGQPEVSEISDDSGIILRELQRGLIELKKLL